MRVVCYTRTTSCWKSDVPASDTIFQQNERIKEYAAAHGWKIAEKYSDRKKNSEENAAFQTMLQDGLFRKFDLVIVDSIYRAGKDLWNAKEVLFQTFHYAGIAFAVVEDDFCSLGKSNDEADRYFDEKYGKLRRETIRYNVNARNKKGILSWSDAKYGYKLSEDNRLIIDENTAPVVKRIFEMVASGIPVRKVADTLWAEQVPSPLSMRGVDVEIQDPYKWTRLSVRRLLDKTVYVGHWIKYVQGEEIPMENEPIVSQEVFDKVQEILSRYNKPIKKPVQKYIYAGLAADKDLGFCLRIRTSRSGEKYLAHAQAQVGDLYGKKISLEKLDEAVFRAMEAEQQKAKRMLVHIHTDGNIYKEAILSKLRDSFTVQAFMIAEQSQVRMEKYRQYTNGEISNEEMEQAELTYQTVVRENEAVFSEIREKQKLTETAFSGENPWIRLFLEWNGEQLTTNKSLKKYISCIEIEQLEAVTVIPNYQEWYEALPAEWREYNGTEKQKEYQN